MGEVLFGLQFIMKILRTGAYLVCCHISELSKIPTLSWRMGRMGTGRMGTATILFDRGEWG